MYSAHLGWINVFPNHGFDNKKDEGIGLCHGLRCFLLDHSTVRDQGSKASAETMDPFAHAPILARATILALRSVAASRPANTGLAEH